MEQLIDEIFEQLKDYRADELLPNVKMTKNRIRLWVEQFDEGVEWTMSCITSAHHDLAPALPHFLETKPLPRALNLDAREMRQLRHLPARAP